jgi:hypothetical protein
MAVLMRALLASKAVRDHFGLTLSHNRAQAAQETPRTTRPGRPPNGTLPR